MSPEALQSIKDVILWQLAAGESQTEGAAWDCCARFDEALDNMMEFAQEILACQNA